MTTPKTKNALTGRKAIVVGAGRGIGRGIALALADAGAEVVAVSRTGAAAADEQDRLTTEIADAADPTVPATLLDRHEPDIVVLVAGATPHMRPLRQQTWETFSVNWQTDVRLSFNWLREILLKPLRPGSRVIVISSGAALNGSPLSGGYAGAKAMQRFMTAYAQDEAKRASLDIAFTALLPRFSPGTGVGRAAVRAYANRNGQSVEAYLEAFEKNTGPLISPEIAGDAVVELASADDGGIALAYLLTGDGLQKLS